MKNKMIAKTLKEARKQNALSVKEVVGKLKEKNISVSAKTIYGWENAQSQPNADTLLLLCEIYNIKNILGSFGYNDEPPLRITHFEEDLILHIRQHPEMLSAVKKLVDFN
ncbi:MAG: helix-turn-helix transcriptional regulator [Eubacterium sp.]|jgi:transcriptional regulator with XRE-family HTH domain|nr:helix-turn-helix transcriptional regulator [Eubacterium sp.]